MPWLERRKRKREAEDWRRENQRRQLDERLELNTPDDESGTPGADAADDGGPDSSDQDDQALVQQITRPDVPVDLGLVDDEEYERAVRRVVSRALSEDLGHGGDLTSMTTVPVASRGRAVIVAREDGVVAGLAVVEEVVRQVDGRIEVRLLVEDGARVVTGDVVARLDGPLRTLLTAERTILNLVCQLSGVATHTAAFADVLEGLDCVVRDTRKTTPGLRVLEKRAVQAGGGSNHRIGLFDAILVKDNHVAAAGGVGAAARAALDGAPESVHVQVEVTSIEEAEEAIAEGVVDLLLDNFTPDRLAVAVEALAGRAAIEASGGITLATARAFAEAGADRLAVGALTHSAPALDLAMDVEEVDAPTPAVSRADVAATADVAAEVGTTSSVGSSGVAAAIDAADAGAETAAAASGGEGEADEIVVDRAPYDDEPAASVEVPDVEHAPFDDRPAAGDGRSAEPADAEDPEHAAGDVDAADAGDDGGGSSDPGDRGSRGRFDDSDQWTSDGGWG